MVLYTRYCMRAKCRASTPGEDGSSQPIVLYHWTRLIPVISCQHRALSSLVLSAQIKLMKCNPLKCPGCISVTGLHTREGIQRGGGRGESVPWQGIIPLCQSYHSMLINPLIQLVFDSQLIKMRSGWSGQDRSCLSTVTVPGMRGLRSQRNVDISPCTVLLQTTEAQWDTHSLCIYLFS